MKFAQGGRRLEKLAGPNKAGSRAPSAPTITHIHNPPILMADVK